MLILLKIIKIKSNMTAIFFSVKRNNVSVNYKSRWNEFKKILIFMIVQIRVQV
jgi:hypothetical protein